MLRLRAALAQWLRDAVMRSKGPLVLRIAAGQPGFPESSLPSLLLVCEMIKQVASGSAEVSTRLVTLAFKITQIRLFLQATEDLQGSLDLEAKLLFNLRAPHVTDQAIVLVDS